MRVRLEKGGPTCPPNPVQDSGLPKPFVESRHSQIPYNLFVALPSSLSFFSSMLFCFCMVHCYPNERIYSLRKTQTSTSCSLATDLKVTSSDTHHFYSWNKFNYHCWIIQEEKARSEQNWICWPSRSKKQPSTNFSSKFLPADPRTTTICTKHRKNEAAEQFYHAKISRTSQEGGFFLPLKSSFPLFFFG